MAKVELILPKWQKEHFENAALLSGFKSLNEFIINSAMEKSCELIAQGNQIILPDTDKEIFFEALINPPNVNEYLSEAVMAYKKLTIKSM